VSTRRPVCVLVPFDRWSGRWHEHDDRAVARVIVPRSSLADRSARSAHGPAARPSAARAPRSARSVDSAREASERRAGTGGRVGWDVRTIPSLPTGYCREMSTEPSSSPMSYVVGRLNSACKISRVYSAVGRCSVGQCYGDRWEDKTRDLLARATVTLERDHSVDRTPTRNERWTRTKISRLSVTLAVRFPSIVVLVASPERRVERVRNARSLLGTVINGLYR
jgi:hypothetical protein